MSMTPIEASEGYIPVTGGRVWYQIVGSGDAIPLLLLHGGPGLSSSYLAPLEALADERPVIRYDQLGGGQSEHSTDIGLWTTQRFVEEVGQVRAALGLERLHLLGHSWGAMLAIEYARTHSVRLASLILAGPALSIPRTVADMDKLRSQLPADVQGMLTQHERAGTTNAVEYQTAAMEFYRRHLCRANASFLERVQESLAKGEGMPPVYQYMWGPSEFTATGPLRDFDCTQHLSALMVPTLLTCGRYDEITPESTAWYQSLIAGSEMVVFERSAHMPHLEETEQYLQVVRDFLRRVEARLG
jgi:proline iminopeptidase